MGVVMDNGLCRCNSEPSESDELSGKLQIGECMVRPERVELPTYWFVASRSIQLSYGRTPLVSSETRDRISGFAGLRNCSFQAAGFCP